MPAPSPACAGRWVKRIRSGVHSVVPWESLHPKPTFGKVTPFSLIHQLFSVGDKKRNKTDSMHALLPLRESGIDSSKPWWWRKCTSVRRTHCFKGRSGRGLWGVLHAKVALEPKSEGRSYIDERWGGNSRCKGPEAERAGGKPAWLQSRLGKLFKRNR